jgi:hypothetical protein
MKNLGSTMDVRLELEKFYTTVKTRAADNVNGYAELRGPDVVWVDDDYFNAPLRVAIVGQQVDGTEYSYREFAETWSIQDAIKNTREFDFGSTYWRTPFWQFFHAVRVSQLGPESSTRSLLWTNLVRFVTLERDSILWKPYAEGALRLQDDILKTELKLTKPDICIFVTGPNYDPILERYFPGIEYQDRGLNIRAFAKLKHSALPAFSYRSYHPKAMRLQNKWNDTLALLGSELGWRAA